MTTFVKERIALFYIIRISSPHIIHWCAVTKYLNQNNGTVLFEHWQTPIVQFACVHDRIAFHSSVQLFAGILPYSLNFDASIFREAGITLGCHNTWVFSQSIIHIVYKFYKSTVVTFFYSLRKFNKIRVNINLRLPMLNSNLKFEMLYFWLFLLT